MASHQELIWLYHRPLRTDKTVNHCDLLESHSTWRIIIHNVTWHSSRGLRLTSRRCQTIHLVHKAEEDAVTLPALHAPDTASQSNSTALDDTNWTTQDEYEALYHIFILPGIAATFLWMHYSTLGLDPDAPTSLAEYHVRQSNHFNCHYGNFCYQYLVETKLCVSIHWITNQDTDEPSLPATSSPNIFARRQYQVNISTQTCCNLPWSYHDIVTAKFVFELDVWD